MYVKIAQKYNNLKTISTCSLKKYNFSFQGLFFIDVTLAVIFQNKKNPSRITKRQEHIIVKHSQTT